MPRLYIVSDTHSHYSIVKSSLEKAGFEANNPNHLLISCGDCFDRGPESPKLLEYLMSINNKVLIRGNHDLLLDSMVERGYPKAYDKHNGTIATVMQLGILNNEDPYQDFDVICQNAYNKLTDYRKQLVNYFETEKYIFVHSWIPTISSIKNKMSSWGASEQIYDCNWRNASNARWEDAMWGNPFALAEQNLNKTGKIIVFGHFNVSWAHARDKGVSEFGEDAIWDIYYNDKQKIIGIDRCIYYTKECNVLVLEDNLI